MPEPARKRSPPGWRAWEYKKWGYAHETKDIDDRLSRQYPEVAEWPAICTVCVGRGLDSALGTMDAADFDLGIMRDAGDSFMKLPGIRSLVSMELEVPVCELNEGQAGMTMA